MRTGRALERAYVREGFQHIKSFASVRTTLTKTAFAGNKIVVVALIRFSAVVRNSEGKGALLSSTSTSRDTWIPTRSGWRIRLTEELS